VENYEKKVKNTVDAIVSIDTIDAIMKACDDNFKKHREAFKEFFREHPTSWPDLQRKIHKYVKVDTH
jgi:hypothetical protein